MLLWAIYEEPPKSSASGGHFQPLLTLSEEFLQGAGRAESDIDPPHADADMGRYFQDPQPDGAHRSAFHLRSFEAQRPQPLQQHISKCTQPEPQLIAAHPVRRGPVAL